MWRNETANFPTKSSYARKNPAPLPCPALHLSEHQAGELSAKTQISAALKPIFCRGNCLLEKNLGGTKEKEAPVTRGHSERVLAWLSPVSVAVKIVNTATGCYFHGQSLALNAVTPKQLCVLF